jgi:hypothetical protein
VVKISEALDSLSKPSRALLTTGLSDLDLLLGGIHHGAVWLVTSPPRHGRSSWAAQLAARAAAEDVQTTVLVGVDGVSATAVKVIAAGTRISQLELSRGRPVMSARDVRLLTRVRGWPLELLSSADTSLARAMAASAPRSLLVVDDLDRWCEDGLDAAEKLKDWALTSGGAAVLTLPCGHATPDSPEWQRWVRVVDVLVDIRKATGDRDGLADLALMHNRRGPTMACEVSAMYFRSQFLDLPPGGLPHTVALSERIQDIGTPAWGSTEDWVLP